jgi:hypothetical protein
MTEDEYNREKDELITGRDQLKNEIEDIKFETDNMRNKIPELEQEVITAYRELYVLKYGEGIGEKVSYKQIWAGMTDEMVRDSWGKPDKIDKNVKPWGVFTQWYYGNVTFFFRDGKLTDWQEGPEE